MDNNFLKPLLTLFGIGAAVSLARSLKSKKDWREVISEMIISGFFATGAAAIMIYFPTVPFIAVAAVASLGTILGVTFFAAVVERALDKYLPKKEDPVDGPKL